MGKLLLVLTGGTICSFAENHVKSPDTEAALPLLLKSFEKSGSPYADTEFDVINLMQELSENLQLEHLNRMRECLCQVDWDEYDGAILAHGTDGSLFIGDVTGAFKAGLPLKQPPDVGPTWLQRGSQFCRSRRLDQGAAFRRCLCAL